MPLDSLLLPVLVAALTLILPGGLVALTLGLRGGMAITVAPTASIALVITAGFLTGVTPLTWGWVPVVLMTALGVAIALGIRSLQHRLVPEPTRDVGAWGGQRELATYGAAALAFVLMTILMLRIFGAADHFSQTFDNFFHMTATRSMMDLGNASPFVLSNFGEPDGARTFYPAAWHQLASFVALYSGSGSLPVAVNALTIAVAGIVWPLSVLFLVRSIVSARPITLVGAGILTGGFSVFPFLPIEYGILYPYLLGLSIVPLGIGLTIQILGIGEGERLPTLPMAATAVLFVPAVSVAHPNALLVVIACTVALTLALAIRSGYHLRTGQVTRRRAATHLAVFIGALLVGILLWQVLRPESFDWPLATQISHAVGEFLFVNPADRAPSLLIATLFMVGFAAIARHPRFLYLLFLTGAILVLWVGAAAIGIPEVRDWLVGGFYNDPIRVAAIIPVGLLPVIIVALDSFENWVGRDTSRQMVRRWIAGAALIALALLIHLGRPIGVAVEFANFRFLQEPDSMSLTPDEVTMINEMPDFVGPDDVVVVDPKTGASFIYAFEGLTPTQFHANDEASEEEQLIVDRLSYASSESEVCRAISDIGADWVLDFGTDQINMHLVHNPPPGLMNLDRSPLLTLVHEVGDTRLFEITGCGG